MLIAARSSRFLRHLVLPSVHDLTGTALTYLFAHLRVVERTREPKGSWERPPPFGEVQTFRSQMHIGTSPGLLAAGVGDSEHARWTWHRDDPQQISLWRLLPTTHTCAERLSATSRRRVYPVSHRTRRERDDPRVNRWPYRR